jgi:flagellar basal-body rod protein FlgC
MELDKAMAISASGLEVQRQRMNVIASNLANVNSTKAANGAPYRRRDVLIRADRTVTQPFGALMNKSGLPDTPGVKAVKIIEDQRPPRQMYEPLHPDANAEGFVMMPDINTIEEMVNLIGASRAYEANVTAMGVTKNMTQRALDIGR